MIHSTFKDYITGTTKVGISVGVVMLLYRTIGNPSFLLHPDGISKYGILGGIGYGVMACAAFMLFGVLGRRIIRESPSGLTIGDYWHRKLTPPGYWIMISLTALAGITALFTQTLAASSLVSSFFRVPHWIGLGLLLLFCLLYAGIGGMRGIQKISIIQISIMFSAAISITVYFFIREGIEHIYSGLRLYHPYLLVVNHHDGLSLMASGFLVGLGQVLMDRFAWQQLFSMEEKKIIPAFALTGLIGSVYPLVLASLAIIVIFTSTMDYTQSLIPHILEKIHYPLLLFLFAAATMGSVSAIIGSELQALVGIILRNIYAVLNPQVDGKRQLSAAYLTAGGIVLLLFISSLLFHPNFLSLMFTLGVGYASLIVPSLIILFSKGKVTILIPLAAVAGMICGWYIQLNWGNIWGIASGATISCILAGIGLLIDCGKQWFLRKESTELFNEET